MQILRKYRYPVIGTELAKELRISLRTLYRNIATLRAQGARIDGAPGLGYLLRPGFMLPPLMFSQEEIEALMLGSRWVMDRGDARLCDAAKNAIAKISAVIPSSLRDDLDASGLIVGPGKSITANEKASVLLRQAIRQENKISAAYRDLKGNESTRVLWPIAFAYFDHVQVLVAWCELRTRLLHLNHRDFLD